MNQTFLTSKIRHSLFSLMIASSCLGGCQTASSPQGIVVDAEGLEPDTLTWYLQAFPFSPAGEQVKYDTLQMVDGRLTYDFQNDTLYKFYLYPASAVSVKDGVEQTNMYQILEFFVEESKPLHISATYQDCYAEYSVEGSASQNQYAQRKNAFRRAHACRMNELLRKFFFGNQQDTLLLKRLNEEYSQIYESNLSENLDYAQKHLSEELSTYYLLELANDSTLEVAEKSLPHEIRQGALGAVIDQRLEAYRFEKAVRDARDRVGQGAVAPDFTAQTLDGKSIALSQFSGRKYVVLDFWGTWCGWCIKGMPAMKRYYGKYKDKVEFIGVACNDKEERWRKMVAGKQLPWPQVLNTADKSEPNFVLRYAVQAFPTKVIISPEGLIVGYYEGEVEEFYEHLDKLFANRPV